MNLTNYTKKIFSFNNYMICYKNKKNYAKTEKKLKQKRKRKKISQRRFLSNYKNKSSTNGTNRSKDNQNQEECNLLSKKLTDKRNSSEYKKLKKPPKSCQRRKTNSKKDSTWKSNTSTNSLRKKSAQRQSMRINSKFLK